MQSSAFTCKALLKHPMCMPYTACGMALVAFTIGVSRAPHPVRLLSSHMTVLTAVAGLPPASVATRAGSSSHGRLPGDHDAPNGWFTSASHPLRQHLRKYII